MITYPALRAHSLPNNPLAFYDCLFVVMSPGLLMPVETFKTVVKEYADAERSRPVEGGSPVRMLFDRSAGERRRRVAADVNEVRFDPRAAETDLRRLKDLMVEQVNRPCHGQRH